MKEPKILLLDAYALIFRAYYAMISHPQVTTTGIDTSAVFGFVNTLHTLLKTERPSHLAVCFDPGGKTFRHEEYDQYKANRDKTPEGILTAVPYIKRILQALGIPVYAVDGFEADDVLGTLANQAAQRHMLTYLVTGDKDVAQLVNEYVKVYHPGKQTEILGVEEVKAKYKLQSPGQVIDLLGLMGDSADNIPGCPGVGPAKAATLLQQFGSVENLLDNVDQVKGNALQRNVRDNMDLIRLSKHLAVIRTDVPITLDLDEMKRRPADMDTLREVFTELEFKLFTKTLIDQGGANDGLDGAPASVPSAQPRERSLFDTVEVAAAPAEVAALAEPLTLLDDEPHDYRLVSDFDEAAALVRQWLQEPRVALHIVADGDEAMRAQIVGLAVSTRPGQAVYLPCDGMGWMMQAVTPLLESPSLHVVSNDVKRDMVMLRSRGVNFAPHTYYDTAVAHYLTQPERGHSTAEIARELLHYQLLDMETPTGTKTRPQHKLQQLPPDRLMPPACQRADVTLRLPELLDAELERLGMTRLLTDMELPLVEVLADMELAGARIDVKALNDYAGVLSGQIETLEQECHRLAGVEFNTASPAQVGEVLFGHLHLDPKAKKTRTGQYSTTEEVLTKLQDRHPLVGKILDLRGKRKLLTTYVSTLPSLINPRTGRIHTTFKQTVTATGRLSSVNPNLQNIPVRNDEGKEIRKAFIPADGNVFFSADYSQIELRLVADMSHDETMLQAFAQGHDIHAITAARIYHEALNDVSSEQRRRAKTANFGILYGISAFGLAQRLNIPRAEAKMLIDGYFDTFPGVKAYIDRNVAQAKEQGYVTTLYGRRRMLPDINSRNAVVRAFSERNAVNAPIQGTAADVIKMAMVRIHRRFRQEGLQSRMILQVHDELNFDVVPAELEQVQRVVIEEMEGVYHGQVRLTASHGAAANWLEAH